MLLLAVAEILCGDVDDAVRVYIEGDLYLRHAAAGRGDAVEVEAAEALVVRGHFALALKDVDLNGGLVVGRGGEHLALSRRDGGVALDKLGEHAAERLYAEGQRRNIDKDYALNVAGENAALDGCADSHALVGVDALEAFLADEGLDHLLHCGDTAGADEQHLGDVAGLEAGVGQRLLDRAAGLFDEVVRQLVELCAGQGHVEVLGACGVGRDVRQVDGGGGHAGKLDLCLLRRLTQTLHCDLIAAQVYAVALLELVNEVLGDALVEVVAAEAVVAGGGQHVDNAVAYLKDGHIEGAAAKVVHHDLLVVLFLVEAVCQCGCGRLVYDTLDLKARDLAGVLRGLTLCVGEVRRNGDDGLGDGLAEVCLGVGLQLLQDHRGNLLRGVGLVVYVHLVVGAHFTLDGGNGTVGVGDGLTLCDLTHHTLAGLCKCNDGRSGARAFGVGDDDGFSALHNCHAAVSSTKIYTYYLTHCFFLLYIRFDFLLELKIYTKPLSRY